MEKTTKTTTATQAPAATAAQPVVKPNARAHLRNLFDKPGKIATADQVFGIKRNAKGEVISEDFKAVTIKTHLTDFKNPTYAGKLGVVNIVKLTDGTYKRLEDAPASPDKKVA